MKQLFFLLLIPVLGLSLVACRAVQSLVAASPLEPTEQPSATLTPQPTEQPSSILALQPTVSQDMTRSDNQGAVTIEVRPINLNDPGDTLTFEVLMNTHSIDLSMDLAALSTLTTADGRTVQATLWDAPRGGHHVSGTLSFPASVDGISILEGSATLTLIIKDVDAPERVFTWNLQQ